MAKVALISLALILIVLPALFSTAEGSACEKRRHLPARKPKVVFVHGFSTGGFSWYRERYLLELLGYEVTAIDLKASGIDPTPVSEVDSFMKYNEPLDQYMATLGPREKVVLVGGSAGGVSVTKTLYDYPGKILVAVYISATMIKSGYVSCGHLEIGVPGFVGSSCHRWCPTLPLPTCFPQSALGWTEIPLKDRTEGYTLGKSSNRPGPLRAIVTANFTGEMHQSSRVDRVPRVYIKTLLDQILLPAQQEAMIKLWPPCEVIQINYGHGVDNPALLSALIINATLYKPTRF